MDKEIVKLLDKILTSITKNYLLTTLIMDNSAEALETLLTILEKFGVDKKEIEKNKNKLNLVRKEYRRFLEEVGEFLRRRK